MCYLESTYSFMVVKNILPHDRCLVENQSDIHNAANTDIDKIFYMNVLMVHCILLSLLLYIVCSSLQPTSPCRTLPIWLGLLQTPSSA